MIIVRISGGLGNQMFQMLMMEFLKSRYPSTIIKADIFDYEKINAHTNYSLEKYFNMKVLIATKEEIDAISYIPVAYNRLDLIGGISGMRKRLQWKLISRKRKKLIGYNIKDYIFNIYNSEIRNLDIKKNWYLNGYWQNWLYYQQLKSEMNEIFIFKRKLLGYDIELLGEIKKLNSVSVHVRRGDYSNSCFDLCDLNYYLKAKIEIEKSVEKPQYFFFSDDVAFVKENFSEFSNKVVIEHSAEDCDYDMQLMASCKHNIIANSSFSFWGAKLRQSSGVVVAPKYVMKINDKLYENLVLQQDWIIIDNSKEE